MRNGWGSLKYAIHEFPLSMIKALQPEVDKRLYYTVNPIYEKMLFSYGDFFFSDVYLRATKAFDITFQFRLQFSSDLFSRSYRLHLLHLVGEIVVDDVTEFFDGPCHLWSNDVELVLVAHVLNFDRFVLRCIQARIDIVDDLNSPLHPLLELDDNTLGAYGCKQAEGTTPLNFRFGAHLHKINVELLDVWKSKNEIFRYFFVLFCFTINCQSCQKLRAFVTWWYNVTQPSRYSGSDRMWGFYENLKVYIGDSRACALEIPYKA